MTHLRVERSAVRQALILFTGLVLVVAAIDIMWRHDVSGAPDRDSNGALTSRGGAQRRQDILWSSVFLVSGGGAIVMAGIGLARRRSVLELTDDGFRLRALGASGYLEVPWSAVESVRSGLDDDGSDVAEPLLIIAVSDPYLYPHNLWGAQWRGNQLRVDTGSWSTPAEDVVLHATVLMGRLEAATGSDENVVDTEGS